MGRPRHRAAAKPRRGASLARDGGVSGGGKRVPLRLSEEEREELRALARGRSTEARLVERAKVVLRVAEGATDSQIAKELRLTAATVRKWRRRYRERRQQKPDYSVEQWIADEQRVGRPDIFDAKFWIDVLALATTDPKECGRPITHWTARELTDEILERKLTNSIHFTTVARFLADCDLQPHRTVQWMNRKSDPEFEARAEDVKECLVKATTDAESECVTISFDEKTGMQAKERIAPDRPMQPGRPAKLEFEYERHGTLVLFGAMHIHSGEVRGVTRITRTNVDTAQVLTEMFQECFDEGYQRIDVIADQLNTHWSVELAETVAELCQLPIPGDDEIKTGAQRRAWLSEPDKPIVFHYTPKHASWLNPIELWFGVLARKVLRRGSFGSTTDLDEKVRSFIDYYNAKLAHPYRFKRWKRLVA